jgi:CPA2 family monovalent cation:H+ antiporter-2
MEDLGLVGDLAIVAIAATAGGAFARWLRLPTVIGYLLAGLVIGPHTPGIVGDIEQTQTIADLGVALLMFTLGLRFSIRQLLEMRQFALIVGLTQIATVLGFGALLGAALGLDWKESVVLGMVASISSTMLALRLLEQRGLIDSLAGRLGVTLALTQDLVVVLFLALLPIMGENDQNVAVSLLLAVATAALFLVGTAVLGPLLIPRVLSIVALSRSRELFIVAVVALALGLASISALAGLSLAFGAFLAGLVISESEYGHQSLTNVIPLRELFAVVFFVAIGMLIDPAAILDDPEIVAAVLVAGIAVKAVVTVGTSRLLGYPAMPVVSSALALANTGEFSFIISEEALDEELVSPTLAEALLAGVFLSLALGAPLMNLDRRLSAAAFRFPALSREGVELLPAAAEQSEWVNHVVICGYGEGAQELASVLASRSFRYIVIDEDPMTIRQLRNQDVTCVLGDPSLRSVLQQAAAERARVVAVTMSNAAQAEDVIREARAINPRIDIVARGGGPESHRRLRELGASEVVHGDLELGLEFSRHSLHRLGVSSREIQMILGGRRSRYLS